MQIWAVDISTWTQDQSSKESLEPLLDLFLGHEPAASAQQQGPANESSARKVMRYIRPVDRIRSLAALLLPRVMYLQQQQQEQQGVEQLTWKTLSFKRTKEGRPFLEPTESNPHPVDFNLSHDGDWVVLACASASGSPSPQSQEHPRIGVDVMSLTLPHYETSVESFIETMSDTMTSAEEQWVRQRQQQSQPQASQDTNAKSDSLSRLYQLWTHKEALTKNMGIGLGFDFKRIEVRFWENRDEDKDGADAPVLMVDGQADPRYRFTSLELDSPTGGKPSLLVVCEGPFTSHYQQQQTQRQLSPALSHQDALQQGLLRVWDISELIQTTELLVHL